MKVYDFMLLRILSFPPQLSDKYYRYMNAITPVNGDPLATKFLLPVSQKRCFEAQI